jgi:hypothetical protein
LDYRGLLQVHHAEPDSEDLSLHVGEGFTHQDLDSLVYLSRLGIFELTVKERAENSADIAGATIGSA